MNRVDPVDSLNRLLQVLYRSLPVYLQSAKPWHARCNEAVCDALANLAEDQQHYARRVAEAIQEAGGRIEPGCFPTSFTGLHDVSADYLRRLAIELQTRDIACIEQCLASLSNDPRLRPLVEEVLGNAKGHLEMLEECRNGEGRNSESRIQKSE